jgi:hypothetical protein
MNATAAISKAFLDGRVLSIKTAFRDFGVTNLPREVSRLIEKRFGVEVSRVPRKGKTRYGISVRWFEYRLPKTPYNEDGIKKMREYVGEHYNTQQKQAPESFKNKNQLGLYD